MNQTDEISPTNQTVSPQELLSPGTLNTLFAQLNPGDVEQFHKGYQAWMLQHQRVALLTQIAILQQKTIENAERMQCLAPSALALASLTQLRSYGVEDIDLLERMLKRGEAWLDHAIQLLERCEQLDVIGSNYTEWCEHALEGAYDWIDSIDRDSDKTGAALAEIKQNSSTVQITEELILQKLMSDNEEEHETEKVSVVHTAAMTQSLSTQDVLSSDNGSTETQDPTQQREDMPMASVELLQNAEATYQVHEIEETEKQIEETEKSTELKNTQSNHIEELITTPPSELRPDLVTDDQLGSSSFDAEDREVSSGIPVNQTPTELSLNAQLTESASLDHLQQEKADIKPGIVIDQVEELQIGGTVSREIEQASSTVSLEQKPAEKRDFEAGSEIDQAEVLQASVPATSEVIQASIAEHAEQELTRDPKLSLAYHEQQPAVSQETQKVEEEKPQQKALPSKRGFLRRSLAKIWHR